MHKLMEDQRVFVALTLSFWSLATAPYRTGRLNTWAQPQALASTHQAVGDPADACTRHAPHMTTTQAYVHPHQTK